VAFVVVAALVAAAAVPAGASVPSRPNASEPTAVTTLSGEVSAGGNVEGARVTIVDADGGRIRGTPSTKTLVGGAFAIPATARPTDFTVVARGGRVNGTPVPGRLVADVSGFEPQPGALISVNAATTLVAGYLDAHPGLPRARAVAKVTRFLGFPKATDLTFTASVPNDRFDQTRFLAEARKQGGIGRFVAKLVVAIDAGKHRSFAATDAETARPADGKRRSAGTAEPVALRQTAALPAGDPEPTDIAAFLFESLRESANRPECLKTPPAESCKDIPFGDVLRFFTTESEKALAEITAKLDLVLEQLAKLKETADTLLVRMDQLTYDVIVGYMNPDAINRAMKTFKEVTENCAASAGSMFCKNQLGDSTVEKPGELRLAISKSLIDNGVIDGVWKRVSGRTLGQTTSGVLDVLPSVVSQDAQRKPLKFFTKGASKALLATLNYFYDVEMTAITLATNYWRWEGRPEKDTLADVNVFDSQIKAQKTVFSPLPEGTVIDLRTGLMWATAVSCSTYSSFGPRETGQCPAKYAGFPVTDQRLKFPGFPYFPYFSSCVAGSWCMGTEGGIGNLVRDATVPWGKWLREQAGISFNGQGQYDTWLVDADCSVWRSDEGRPVCDARRRYVNWEESEVQWSATKDRNAAWYLFVRQPNEAARYH
jgi:hypothetical protein